MPGKVAEQSVVKRADERASIKQPPETPSLAQRTGSRRPSQGARAKHPSARPSGQNRSPTGFAAYAPERRAGRSVGAARDSISDSSSQLSAPAPVLITTRPPDLLVACAEGTSPDLDC